MDILLQSEREGGVLGVGCWGAGIGWGKGG